MNLAKEILEIRAKKKAQTRNERAAKNALEYRDGYAAAFADYTAFREPIDGLEEIAALNEKHVAGYRAGYADAKRGAPCRTTSPMQPNKHILECHAPPGTFPLPSADLTIIDRCELIAWRALGGRIQFAVEDLLSRQGDAATPETISLQHDLVELRQTPFGGLPLNAINQTFP